MQWKKVNGYEGIYEINTAGQIRRPGGSFLGHWNNGKGYRYIQLWKDGKKRNHYIHRLVADAFLDIDPSRPDVNHKNGIKDDNRLENLERCNKSENMRHAFDSGLVKRTNNKLAAIEVNIIRRMWSAGIHRDKIKEVFEISNAQISRIVRRNNWKKQQAW